MLRLLRRASAAGAPSGVLGGAPGAPLRPSGSRDWGWHAAADVCCCLLRLHLCCYCSSSRTLGLALPSGLHAEAHQASLRIGKQALMHACMQPRFKIDARTRSYAHAAPSLYRCMRAFFRMHLCMHALACEATGALMLQARKSMASSLFVAAAAALPARRSCICSKTAASLQQLQQQQQQQQQEGDSSQCPGCAAEVKLRQEELSDAALRLLNDEDSVKVRV